MTKFQSILGAALISVVALVLAGCGSGTSSGSTGKVSFFMTDAPVDEAYAVVIAITHFEVKPAEGQAFRLEIDHDEGETYRQINLLDYTKGNMATIVSDEELDVGEYEWLRIFFDADYSYIQIDEGGGMYPFFMPSGAQTGYKVIGGFSVREGEAIDYVLDFNVRESVLEPPGLAQGLGYRFLLKPTVRLMEIAATGAVTGTVDSSLVTLKNKETCPGGDAVYAFEGFDVDPVGKSVLPFISDIVEMNSEGQFEYAFPFLPPGPYTLAFTCSAKLDSAEGEDYAETYPPDALEFSEQINVEIVARETKQCDIPLGEDVEGHC
jgi:hypothetical protein